MAYAISSAAVQLGPNLQDTRIYFQRPANDGLIERIRRSQYTTLRSANQVRANTPIAAITEQGTGGLTHVGISYYSHTKLLTRIINGQIRVYYVNNANVLSDHVYTRSSETWAPGTLADQEYTVVSDSRFLYALNGTADGITIRVGFLRVAHPGNITEARYRNGTWITTEPESEEIWSVSLSYLEGSC
jgi:hypothetical protein